MTSKRRDEEGLQEPDQGVSYAAGSPVSDDFERLDAVVRRKAALGIPFTDEERAIFARIPGSKEISPKDVQDGKVDVDHQ